MSLAKPCKNKVKVIADFQRDAGQEIAGELLNREADGGGDSLEPLVTDGSRLSWL
jgi:hypothetical protein